MPNKNNDQGHVVVQLKVLTVPHITILGMSTPLKALVPNSEMSQLEKVRRIARASAENFRLAMSQR